MTATDPAGVCPACAGRLVGTETTCPSCGSPNLPARRQVVTVLFADLAGYTRLTSELDAEQVHVLIRPLMNAVRKECERFGGVVSGIEGDGIMAVFGAPRPREDDPLRAVSAAVALHRVVDARRSLSDAVPALRVGLNSGEVLLAPSWEASGFSVSGDVVNVAARLCKASAPGSVLVGRDTVALVPSARWSAPTGYDVRNREQTVTAHELLWDRTSPAHVVTAPDVRPYIARPRLESALRDALGSPQPVVVVGDAGIGKTRLLQGLQAELTAAGRPVLSVFTPRGREVVGPSVVVQLAAQLPAEVLDGVSALTRRRLRLARGESVDSNEADADAQVAAAVAEGVWSMPDVVVILDDADQFDAEEQLGLRALLERPTGTLIAAGRELEPWAARAQVLHVDGLDEDEMGAFVETLLPGASPSLRQSLTDLTGGVPLFLEQCVSTLLEDGTLVRVGPDWRLQDAERLRTLPTSMRVFLEARLARLPAAERHALGVASVLGNVVDPDLLRHLLGGDMAAVEALVDKDLLRWDADALTGERRLRFRHALLAETAYAGELRSQRVAIHRVAAEWYAALPVSHVLESQARHLVAAVDLGSADCETVRQAVETLVYFARSVLGERLTAAGAALETAERIVAEHPQCEVPELGLWLTQSSVLLQAGQDERAAERALAAAGKADEAGDPIASAEAAMTRASALALVDPEVAAEELLKAEAVFETTQDRAGLARVAIERARLAERYDGLVQRRVAYELAYHAGQVAADRRLTALAAQDLAVHSFVESRTAVDTWSARAAEQMRQDDEIGPARLLLARGIAELAAFEHAEAVVTLRAARQAAQDCGLMPLLLNAQANELEALSTAGMLDEAVARWEVAGAVADARPTPHARVNIDQQVALAWSRSGQGARAAARLAELEAVTTGFGDMWSRDWCVNAGQLALEAGDVDRARRLFERALELDDPLQQPFARLKPAYLHLVASVLGRHRISLLAGTDLRGQARDRGAPRLEELTTLWLQVDELLHGREIPVFELGPVPSTPEGRALHTTVRALSTGAHDELLAAAEAWAELGDTVFLAMALLWHEELTGQPHPEALEVLERLAAPEGTADRLRALVRRT